MLLIITVQGAKNMWSEYEQVDVFIRVSVSLTERRSSDTVEHQTNTELCNCPHFQHFLYAL